MLSLHYSAPRSSRPRRPRLFLESLESRELLAAPVVSIAAPQIVQTGPTLAGPATQPGANGISGPTAGNPTALNNGTQQSAGFTSPGNLSSGTSSLAPTGSPLSQQATSQALSIPTISGNVIGLTPPLAAVDLSRQPSLVTPPSPVPDQGYFLFGDEAALRDAYRSDLPANSTQGEFRISAPVTSRAPPPPPASADALIAAFADPVAADYRSWATGE